MKDHIEKALKQIEEDYEVKILFACDGGSRSLGFASKNSDYDIRFIYIHNQDWYLSIDQERDVIEIPKHDELSIPVDPLLDVSGWELRKALRLFRKSNPSLLEWLNSKTVYVNKGKTVEKLRSLQEEVFSPKPYISHHLNLAKRNFTDLQKKEKGRIKLYLYILRSIMAAKWIEKQQTVPPVNFIELLTIIPDCQIKEDALKLLAFKQSGKTIDTDRNSALDEFIETEIKNLSSYANQLSGKKTNPTEKLNTFFREMLKESWKQ